MNFTSIFFLPLYAVTALLYPRLRSGARVLLLLIASWTFFMVESPGSGVILLAVTMVTYAAGLLMDRLSGKMKTRSLLLTSVLLITLGILGVFKYSGRFFLPAGISFYTFQALSYIIDVYRGDFPAERQFHRYALYLSFFPQVVAGPIEKPGDLMGQLRCEAPVTEGDFRVGGYLMLRGYVKKIVIADALAPVVDGLFARAGLAGTGGSAASAMEALAGGGLAAPALGALTAGKLAAPTADVLAAGGLAAPAADALAGGGLLSGPCFLAAAILFSLQIYADFSGYSDIALGAARMLGIRLTVNFKNPYLAEGIRDFWRRWHITLSRWLREYVYIPLGGNRKGGLRTALNTLAVFAVSGVWHGRGVHFLVWGLAHGVCVLAEDLLPGKGGKDSVVLRRLRQAGTFLLVALLWILFRASTLREALEMYAALPTGWAGIATNLAGWIAGNRLAFLRLLPAVPLLLILRGEPRETDVPAKTGALIGGYLLFLITLVSLYMNLQSGGAAPFIYFRF